MPRTRPLQNEESLEAMKKTNLTRKLMAACSIVALSAVMYGCVHSGDDPAPIDETDMEMPVPVPVPDPGPTDLEATQTAAADAAAAAMTAAATADTAADGAEAATINIATLQTNGKAADYATAAREAADSAMAAYADAKAASEAAAAATTGAAAEEAWAMADTAQTAAEAAETTATEMADAALAAAMTELHIDGTVKTVGDISVDALAVITGMNPMATGEAIDGEIFVLGDPDMLDTGDMDESTPDTAYEQAAAARTFAIGKTLDSSDGTARLMIVTDYADTNMVRVYAPGIVSQMGTKAGYLTINDNVADNDDANNTPLRSEGMFVAAGDAANPSELISSDLIAATAKPVELFSYVPPTGADNAGVRQYATLTSTTEVEGGDTTYTYATEHDITAPTAADGPDEGTEVDQSQIVAAVPGPVAYKHLNFGVWAELGEPNADGAQDIAGFGIGFVQSIGDGMTGADMPNAGTASYSGNWVGVVLQGAGDDSMALEHRAAELEANFGELTLTAELTDLATLSGTIDGSMFEGDTATVEENEFGLTPGGDFDGEFSGGFYGAKAAEAGGVFDFSSDNSGAFRGAFGGAKAKDE